jgi:hypothetical protein
MKVEILIILAVICFACTSQEADQEEVSLTYSISGVVTKSDGGAAAGASVALTKKEDGSLAGQSPVNADGAYIITGVVAGSYNLSASLSGYETGEIQNVSVGSSDVTDKNIVLQKIMEQTYSVSGKVTLPDGKAAAGATVQVRKASDGTNVGQAVKTDETGNYLITGIPKGEYTVIVSLEGYETQVSDVLQITGDGKVPDIALQAVTVNTDAVTIQFAGNQAVIYNPYASKGIEITTDGAHITVSSSMSSITEYVVSGATTNGSLKIQSPADFHLTLNGADITSASTLPPIQITKNEGVATIELKGTNYLKDASSNAENATLISKKGALTFEGFGSLTVSGAAKHAIASETATTVQSGDIIITSAVTDGIHSNGFTNVGGTLRINASSDGIDAGEGTVTFQGGKTEITATQDDTKGVKTDGVIVINKGILSVSVSGVQSKGISGKQEVNINGGEITVTCSGAAYLEPVGSGYDPSYCTAVKSDGNITVTNGNILIVSEKTSDGGKGISADGDILISGGTINIQTAGDGKTYKTSTGANDSYTAACIKGDKTVSITGGNIVCSSSGSGGKGVSAVDDMVLGLPDGNNADLTLTVSTTGARFSVSGSTGGGGWGPGGGGIGGAGGDYANPKAIRSQKNLIVHSGTIVVNSTNDGGEGFESEALMTINGGNINIHTYDDCLNGGTGIVINGGNIYCEATGNDAIDSNSNMTVNGGLIIANSLVGEGEAFDSERTFTINGGILVGANTGQVMTRSITGTQKSVRVSTSTGSAIGIKNSKGEYLLLYNIPSGSRAGTSVSLTFSDPRLVSGAYTFQSGGSITGGVTVNGYNTGGSYSGGASKDFSL